MKKIVAVLGSLLWLGLFAVPAQAQTGHPVRLINRCDHPLIFYVRWTDPKLGDQMLGPSHWPASQPAARLGFKGKPLMLRDGGKLYLWATSTDGSMVEFSGDKRFTHEGVSWPMMEPATAAVDGDVAIQLACTTASPAGESGPPCPPDAAGVKALLQKARNRRLIPDDRMGPEGGTYAVGSTSVTGARPGSFVLNAPGGTISSLTIRMPGSDVEFYTPRFQAAYPDATCDGARGCVWAVTKPGPGQLQAATLRPSPSKTNGFAGDYFCEYRR